METPERNVADAIRLVTAVMQNRIESGERASMIDAHDLIECLLSIADVLDQESVPSKEIG